MPRGAPDYSNVRAYGPQHRLDDMAELAVRLGSPVGYDRGGNVVWFTDFRHGLQGASPGGSDAECESRISTERSHFGGTSLFMDPSDADGSYVEWGTVVQFLPEGKMGLEALISLSSDPAGVRLKMLHFDGDWQHRAEVHYVTETGDWLIKTSETTWVTVIEGFKLQPDATAWNPIKLIMDIENETYSRLQVANREVEIDQYSLYKLESENLGHLACRVMVYGYPTQHAGIWVDAVIITQSEP